ncbi:MAG: AMP-binding protein, partial [Syntrophomonadaceae bacterium]|nr:AMP-binding protein [Syntrophomonadaceae bacterium]
MERITNEANFDWEQGFANYLNENKTLAYMMLNRTADFISQPALRHKVDGEWVTVNWQTFREQIRYIAKALLELDLLTPGDRAGLFSANRAEWAIADLGILAIRGISVPIYATNSAEEAKHIVNDAGVKILFVGDQIQYDKAKSIITNNPYLKKIIAFDRNILIQDEDSIYLDELLEIGQKAKQDEELEKHLNQAKPDDVLTLIYTSGTTGAPKGAVHTHRSFMGGIYPSRQRFPQAGPGYVSLAILPLSHVFERMWSYGCMSIGVEIAYCPDPKQFVEIMSEVKPQFMTSVPRIWEKVYATIHDGLKTASPIKAGLFKWAERVAIDVYRDKRAGKKSSSFLMAQYALADKLIIQKVQETLGAENS